MTRYHHYCGLNSVAWWLAVPWVLMFALLVGSRGGVEKTLEVPLPSKPTFVSSETCKTCHPDKYHTWLLTSHAYALREPSDTTVLGRFDGQVIETPYFKAVPYRKDGQYRVNVVAKDKRPSGDHQVTRVVGKTIGQSYLFTGPRGEWRILPVSWNIERSQWDLSHRVMADINGELLSFPDNFDSREKVFNDGCGQCHATHYDIAYDEEKALYSSRFLEGSVACESCHGPGSVHVEWHKTQGGGGRDYKSPARLLQPVKDLDAKGILATCGRCHYKHDWRFAIDDDPMVPFNDIAISRNYDGLGFFADGRVSGLNYHGTTQSQSACFRGGMSCLSCHQMHGGKLRALKWEPAADAQCTQCHAKVVSHPLQHSHHKNVRCVDCHMPKLIAGVLHFMRDHMRGNPEPELTERYGKEHTPNACGICHSDRSPRWAREWKDRWWRPAPRALIENVGLVVDLRKRVPVDPRRIDRMAQDSNNRLFFRLTAIQELALRHDSVSRASLRRLLSDEQDEVRQLASLGIAEDPHPEAATTLERLLDDPCRVVRVEAAYALARCGWRGNSAKMERAYGDALKMRERQRSFDDILERLATLADALEREKEMTEHLRLLSGRQTAIRTSGDLLNRYARVLIEEGHFQKALEFCEQSEAHYARKHGALEPMFQQRLFLDFADSLAALGRQKEALKYWEKVGTIAPQDSLAALIAAARKMALLGQAEPERHEVESALGRFSDDLAVGELRRRALWTLKVLESVKDTH